MDSLDYQNHLFSIIIIIIKSFSGSINFSALGVSDTQPSFIGNIGGPAVKTDRK